MRLFERKFGQSLAEYAILAAIVGLVGLTGLLALGNVFNTSWPALMASIFGQSATAAAPSG